MIANYFGFSLSGSLSIGAFLLEFLKKEDIGCCSGFYSDNRENDSSSCKFLNSRVFIDTVDDFDYIYLKFKYYLLSKFISIFYI